MLKLKVFTVALKNYSESQISSSKLKNIYIIRTLNNCITNKFAQCHYEPRLQNGNDKFTL